MNDSEVVPIAQCYGWTTTRYEDGQKLRHKMEKLGMIVITRESTKDE